ncbi:hypothetical protein [Pseudoleptotrichia goodfellowii]|uniref:Hemolysin n=1 Tax=Pseudoleptotrichia goodfellowii TaxID=157692 RepID=A0A510JFH1_9FUSO|nr:hypothetical protein [Pseudoleptotrichia goodfellowii]BBM37151.1 hypothetical protein JCM16774_2110 [Pseudoleptotrichia goodfellowii]
MNFPNGGRAYVDNQTTFILGEGSNLTIGKVENTAGIIGEGNGKLKINEYKGKDLYNHDSLTTTGGSIGTSGAGISNENHRKEGITRHTVIGNVEIGSATGSSINRDRSKANETTRDDHSSTNVYVESQTIDYALHPAKFKEDVGIAVLEGSTTVEGALKKIDNILRGDDNSDISEPERRRYEEIKENIIRFKTAPDMKLIAEGDLSDPDVQKRLGIGGRFNPDDPNLPEKIKERIAQVREQGQEINYFYDKVTGKIYINENANEDEIRAGIGREWGIRDEFDRGRTKPNGEGQEKGTVAGEIAYKEIEDRTKGKSDKKVNPYDFEYAQFDPNSEVTGDYYYMWEDNVNKSRVVEHKLLTKRYAIGSNSFLKDLTDYSYKTPYKIAVISPYFGFYYLPKEVQNKYMSRDEDGTKGLRVDVFDPKGFRKLENSKPYTIAMYKTNIEVFKSSISHFNRKGLVSGKIKNEVVKQNFIGEKNVFGGKNLGLDKAILSPEDLDITYRNGSVISKTIIDISKNEKGLVVKITRRHKLFDEFSKPLDLAGGFIDSRELGNPYNLLTNYQNHVVFEGVFKNKDEAIKYLNDRVDEAKKKLKELGEPYEEKKK